VALSLSINGELREIQADPQTPLLYVLRGELGLKGAKLGCGLEQCGSCAVLVDGVSTLSCARPVAELAGREIVTIEGLGRPGALSQVQRAFAELGAAQCGYCTPGIVVAVTALLRETPRPSEAQVREALKGHLCRCGSHPTVLAAIDRLIGEERDGG